MIIKVISKPYISYVAIDTIYNLFKKLYKCTVVKYNYIPVENVSKCMNFTTVNNSIGLGGR